MRTTRPNLFNLSFDIGGFEVESGYNGKSGWMRDSRNGLRTLTGDASIDFQAEAVYRNSLWLNAKKERSKITSGGRTDVGGHPANVVVITTAKGPRISLFFDSSTNLLLAEEFASSTSKRRYEYEDHRNINGLTQPSKIRFEIDGTAYEVTFEEIDPNARIARSEFKRQTPPVAKVSLRTPGVDHLYPRRRPGSRRGS